MHLPRALLYLLVLYSTFVFAESSWAKKNLNYSNLPTETQQDLQKRFPGVEKEKLSLDQIDEIIRFLQLRPQYQ